MLSLPAQAANVIFDLGGVLIDTSKSAAAQQLGLGSILMYMLSTGKGPSAIKTKLYEILHNLDHTAQNNCYAKDYEGQTIPALMCDWMTSAQTPKEILSIVLTAINANPEWFGNKTEQRLVRNTARLMFTPKLLAETRSFIKDGVKFAKKCKKEGHHLYILSNWDKESLLILKENKHFKEFFDLFDGIAISGEQGVMKPQAKFYKNLLKQYNLNPHESVFIDDQPENIEAAEKLGIHGILYKNTDFTSVEKQFEQWEQHNKLAHIIWV